ncbi:MAG: DUF695 domain-containing protein [Terricaulis sp.]
MQPGDKVALDLPSDDRWTLFNVQRRGLPEVLLVNDAMRGFAPREIFPWHLSTIIAVVGLAERGMPDPEEQETLNLIGNEIEDALAVASTEFGAPNVLYFARSTWNGQRELMFRVHDPEIANGVLHAKIASKKWERDWDFRIEADSEWTLTAPLTTIYPAS